MSQDAPSVRLLLDSPLQEMLESHGDVKAIQQIARGCDLLDEALLPYLESGAAMAELSPADVTADDELRPLVVRALSRMPPDFAALTGKTPAGELLRGASFWESARAAQRAPKSPSADIAVFYQLNLQVLRVASPAQREAYPSPNH